MRSVRVRTARPSDFPAVQSLVFSSHAKAMAAIGRDVSSRLPMIFPSLASAEEFIKPASQGWVAFEDGADDAILGAITIISSPDPLVAELNAFYVQEGHQRRGIGGLLVEAALHFCRSAGVRRVELTSNKCHYDPAIRYYERLGFQHVKEYEVAPGIVLVDLVLELK